MAVEKDKTRELAESAMLMLISRVSGPILVMLCGIILSTIFDMKSSVATVVAKMEAHDNRLSNLEQWRATLESHAENGR